MESERPMPDAELLKRLKDTAVIKDWPREGDFCWCGEMRHDLYCLKNQEALAALAVKPKD